MRTQVRFVLGFLSIVVLSFTGLFTETVQGAILEIDKSNTNFSQGNKLTLLKEPDIQEFRVTTNIPSSRVEFRTDKAKYSAFQQQYDHKYLIIKNPTPNDTVTAYYKNAGTYEGRPIDLMMTFSNMNYQYKGVAWGRDQIHLQISESPFSGYVFYNMSHGIVEYSFYDSKTGRILNVDGNSFLTFNSLNGEYPGSVGGEFYNYLNYDVSQNNSPVDAYVINGTNIALRSKSNLPYKSPIFIGESNNFMDWLGSPTFTRNSVSFQIRGTHHKFVFGSGSNSAWQTPSSGVLFNVTAPDPTKEVVTQSGINATDNYVFGGEKITYRIGQQVHVLGQDIMEKYDSIVIKDNLPNEVMYDGARLVDENGNTVRNAGHIDYDSRNHRVTFTASQEFLKETMVYNGETYYLEIDVTVKDLHDGVNGRDIVFQNQASVIVNDVEKDSNMVTNKIRSHLAEIGLKKVQIFTDKASNGLPFHVELSHRLISAGSVSDFIEGHKIKLQVKDKSTGDTVFNKTYALDKLDNLTIDGKIPSDDLSRNSVKNYEFLLSYVEGLGLRMGSNNKIELEGHTATEGRLSPEDDNGIFTFEGVVMTEREYSHDMVTYDERLEIKYIPVQRVKSGYAFNLYAEATYTNEVLDLVAERVNINRSVDMTTRVDHRLLDKSLEYFEDNVTYNGDDTVQIDATRSASNTDTSTTTVYHAPHIFLEQESGMMFTKNQKNNGELRGKAIDAGNRLYVPVWDISLGEYDLYFMSKNAIGSHRISFEIPSKVDVYAFMFHHIDSDTVELDELLLHPVREEDMPDVFN